MARVPLVLTADLREENVGLVSQLSYGDPDGYGVYGVLQQSDDGCFLLCHECGKWFEHLGLHAATSTTAPPTTGSATG